MDAGAARRLLHGRRRMFDSASFDFNRAAVDDSAFPFRARRNIFSVAFGRWYSTPGKPLTSRLGRPLLNDQRWSRCNGSIPLNAPASRRGVMKPTRKPPRPTAAPGKEQGGNTSSNENLDLLDQPHRMSPQALGPRKLIQQAEELQKQLHEEAKAHEATKRSLHAQESALKAAEAARHQMQQDHDAKFQRLDGEAYDRAKHSILQEMARDRAVIEQHLQEAQYREEASANTLKRLKKAHHEAAEFNRTQKEQHVNEVERAKEGVREKLYLESQKLRKEGEVFLTNRFASEVRKLNEAGASRAHERGSYEEYRAVWRSLDDEVVKFSKHILPAQKMSSRYVALWTQTRNKFNPENIEPWFPQRYPKITEQLKRMLSSKLAAAQQRDRDLQAVFEGLKETENDVRSSGHYSRKLSHYHRFDDDRTAATSISLCKEMLDEVPLHLHLSKLDKDLRIIEEHIASTVPGRKREPLEQSRTTIKTERMTIATWLAAYSNFRKAETLKVLCQSASKVQEVYARPLALKELISHGDREWAAYTRQGDRSEGTPKDRAAFLEGRGYSKDRLRDFERTICKRQLLEESLGDPVDEDARKTTAERLAEAMNRSTSDFQVKIREAIGSRRRAALPSQPTMARPLLKRPQATESAAAKQERAYQRQGQALKAELATAKGKSAKAQIGARLREHNRTYVAWQSQRSKANKETRKAQAMEQGEVRSLKDDGAVKKDQQSGTRQAAGSDGDVTAAEVTVNNEDASQTSAPKKSARTKLRERRLGRTQFRNLRLIASDKAPQSTPEAQDNSTEGFTAGLNLKPTEAKQSAHVFWPPFSGHSIQRDRTVGILHPAMYTSGTATSTFAADDSSFHIARRAETVQVPLSSHSTNSQSSDSSYQPSERPNTEPSESQSSANDQSESPEDDGLPQLQYHISETDYRNAAKASPNTAAAYWTHKLYKNGEAKNPPVYYCTTLEQAEIRAKEFLDEPVIGFDIEWEMRHTPGRSGIKKNVSLIQIAADDKIALFHIAVFKGESIDELMPASLRKILESRDVAKAGVNIQGDAWRMDECLNVKMTGIFELSHLYRVVMFSETPDQINRRPFKLADQVQNVLLLPLKKDAVRTSAWSKKLDMQQSDYAASDAYAGFRLYHALEAKRRVMDPMPPRPAFYEEHQPIQLGDGTLIQAKTRRKAAAGGKKAAEAEDDDEDEEFFDAVESMDAYDLDAKSAGVPLPGLSITYPTLPSIEDELGPSLGALRISGPGNDNNRQEKAPKRAGPPPSEAVDQAEQWVANWRASRPEEYVVKASHAQLRAYALWHKQALKCKDVAALLRDTPLSLQTVATYVLEALRHENLEYGADEARDALNILPPTVHRRYGKVLEEVGR